MFSTLKVSDEARKRRGVAFIVGVLCQVLMIGAAILVGILFPNELPIAHHYIVAWLPPLTPPEKPPVVQPPREVPRVFVPRPVSPEVPKLTAPPIVRQEVPKTPPTVAALPVPTPPASPRPMAPPTPPPVKKEEMTVHTGLFGGAPQLVTTKRPVEQVQTGGFGSPQGLPGRAQGDSPGNVPKLGSFGLPEGPGMGNGTGGAHGVPGVVASAGFGSAVGSMGDGHAPGGAADPKVTVGGFQKAAPATPSPAESHPVAPAADFQSVEILSKPNPVYTDEARRLGIQGEVMLSVIFQANGALRVISVVKSLGHGLDQAAQQAAMQIRFKPAQRSGQPVDFPANLRIQFRLADQPT